MEKELKRNLTKLLVSIILIMVFTIIDNKYFTNINYIFQNVFVQ